MLKEVAYTAIGELMQKLERTDDMFEIEALRKRIFKLERSLGDTSNKKSLNITNRIEAIMKNKR